MAIPNRTTVTCPHCGTAERTIIGDSSVGPHGRVSETPLYSMRGGDLWDIKRRVGVGYVSCKTCGETDFATLPDIVETGARWR